MRTMPPILQSSALSPVFPATLKVVSQVISQALQWDTWQPVDDNTRYQRLELCHYGMAQRWLVVYSQAALERAEATLNKARQREDEAITQAALSPASPTLLHARSRPRGPGGVGQALDSITGSSPLT